MEVCHICGGKGKFYDVYGRSEVVCPECKDKRVEEVRSGASYDDAGLFKRLGIPRSIAGGVFDLDLYIARGSRGLMVPDSVDMLGLKLEELLHGVTAGVLPKESILINLGPKAYESHYIALLYERAYMSGLTLAPYLTGYDILELRLREERGYNFEDGDLRYKELLDGMFCVVMLDAGSTYNSCMAVKGLMQMRALKGLPTIIFSAAWGRDVLSLCKDSGDESSYGLATIWTVEYKKDEPAVSKKSVDSVDNSVGQGRLSERGIRGSGVVPSDAFDRLMNGKGV